MRSNELMTYSNDIFGKVRAISKDGKVYFNGNDIANALGYSDTAKAVRVHCKGVAILSTPSNGGLQKTKFITESDVIRLIMSSALPSAESFQDWVFEEVIPSILKDGKYDISKEMKEMRKPTLSKTRVDAFFAVLDNAGRVFSLDDVTKQRMYNQFAKDNDLPLLDYVKSENGNRDCMKNMLLKFNVDMSVQSVNKKLTAIGILEIRTRTKSDGTIAKFPVVTEKGKIYGDNFQSEHSPKQTQPLWYENQFPNLLKLL